MIPITQPDEDWDAELHSGDSKLIHVDRVGNVIKVRGNDIQVHWDAVPVRQPVVLQELDI